MLELVKNVSMGREMPPVKPWKAPDSGKFVYEQNVTLDEKTLEPSVKISKRVLDKEIQSYKDECGMAYVLRQIAAGRLSITDIADDGKSGGDITGMPETLNQACQDAITAQEIGKQEAAKLGLKAFTEEELQNFVNAEIKKAKEAQAKAAEGGEK